MKSLSLFLSDARYILVFPAVNFDASGDPPKLLLSEGNTSLPGLIQYNGNSVYVKPKTLKFISLFYFLIAMKMQGRYLCFESIYFLICEMYITISVC